MFVDQISGITQLLYTESGLIVIVVEKFIIVLLSVMTTRILSWMLHRLGGWSHELCSVLLLLKRAVQTNLGRSILFSTIGKKSPIGESSQIVQPVLSHWHVVGQRGPCTWESAGHRRLWWRRLGGSARWGTQTLARSMFVRRELLTYIHLIFQILN